MIYLRFIADKSLISKLIGIRSDGKPSHVEYVITDDNGNPTITFGARLKGGVVHRTYAYCKPDFEEWYSFIGIEASYAEAIKLDGRQYDWKDICELLIGWHPKGYSPQEAICSVLVGYSNRMAWGAGSSPPLINPNVPTWQMTPQLLYGAVTQMVKKVL